jgi:hypothetical protein
MRQTIQVTSKVLDVLLEQKLVCHVGKITTQEKRVIPVREHFVGLVKP